jgi:hypothetical protein
MPSEFTWQKRDSLLVYVGCLTFVPHDQDYHEKAGQEYTVTFCIRRRCTLKVTDSVDVGRNLGKCLTAQGVIEKSFCSVNCDKC